MTNGVSAPVPADILDNFFGPNETVNESPSVLVVQACAPRVKTPLSLSQRPPRMAFDPWRCAMSCTASAMMAAVAHAASSPGPARKVRYENQPVEQYINASPPPPPPPPPDMGPPEPVWSAPLDFTYLRRGEGLAQHDEAIRASNAARSSSHHLAVHEPSAPPAASILDAQPDGGDHAPHSRRAQPTLKSAKSTAELRPNMRSTPAHATPAADTVVAPSPTPYLQPRASRPVLRLGASARALQQSAVTAASPPADTAVPHSMERSHSMPALPGALLGPLPSWPPEQLTPERGAHGHAPPTEAAVRRVDRVSLAHHVRRNNGDFVRAPLTRSPREQLHAHQPHYCVHAALLRAHLRSTPYDLVGIPYDLVGTS
jgi:hypothetical protein